MIEMTICKICKKDKETRYHQDIGDVCEDCYYKVTGFPDGGEQ